MIPRAAENEYQGLQRSRARHGVLLALAVLGKMNETAHLGSAVRRLARLRGPSGTSAIDPPPGLAALGLVVALGCGGGGKPTDTPRDGGATGEDAAAQDSGAGPFGACGAGVGCRDGLMCINPEGRGGGTCTTTCSANDECGEAMCAETQPRVCALPCDGSPASCSEGTECVSLGGDDVCLGPPPAAPPCVEGGASLDLLFMVDNSNSMAQEQLNLTTNFPRLIDALVSPPDANFDGSPDWVALGDLHVGVVSSDVGTGGFVVTTCADAVDGDNGELLHQDHGAVEGCEVEYPAFLEGPGEDPAAMAADFTCIATLGTGGCGFEQQLESVRRALVDRAGDTNAGFLREDTALAIVLVTDEDDCSVSREMEDATDIFDKQLQIGHLNLRCFTHPEYLESVDSFVEDLLGLRPDHPERIVVAAITGIPQASGCNLTRMADADFQCVLDLPDMQKVVDEMAQNELVPSCRSALGAASPPRRIVQFLRGISDRAPGSAFLASICEPDWTAAVAGLAEAIGHTLCRPIE